MFRVYGDEVSVLCILEFIFTLRLQIAQSRYHFQTSDPKVGTICILGVLGLGRQFFSRFGL